jgi:two-component system response regulator NreC
VHTAGAPTRSKTALVDDHHIFRAGLRVILAELPEVAIVGEASDAREAYLLVDSAKPDLVVLDLVLPDGDGIAATREIRRRAPASRVLVLTMQTSELAVARALAAGASGFVLKTDEPAEIHRAVRTVLAGRRHVSVSFGDRAADLIASTPQAGYDARDPLASLSRREREVCDLVLRGLSNQSVAEALCISVKTVETHRARINQKLGVHSTGQLMRLAALEGLISS